MNPLLSVIRDVTKTYNISNIISNPYYMYAYINRTVQKCKIILNDIYYVSREIIASFDLISKNLFFDH